MNDQSDGLFLFLAIIFYIMGFIIAIYFTRWLFSINQIVDYLKRIADKLDPSPPSEHPPPPVLPKAACDCCHKEFFVYQLSEYAGKNICSSCKKFLAKK